MPKSHDVSRREFVQVVMAFVGAVIGGVIGIPAIAYLIDPASKVQQTEGWVPLGKPEDFEVGVPTLRTFTRSKINGWEKTTNSYGVYVIKDAEGGFTVLSNVCTHLSCRVTWNAERVAYVCPCHDGLFDIQGNVLKEPAPRPLDLYESKIDENGMLSINFKTG